VPVKAGFRMAHSLSKRRSRVFRTLASASWLALSSKAALVSAEGPLKRVIPIGGFPG
jgi:hypothetical protein